MDQASAPSQRLVIVGNGMVAWKLCVRLVERDVQARFCITVLGEESRPAYDRVHLTDYLTGKTADDLTLADAEWYAAHGIGLRLGTPVVSLDRDAHVVHTEDGTVIPYDKLVLAIGSSAWVPPVPGAEKAGVFVYRTLDDLDAIRDFLPTTRSCVVVGGGLLGLEAARAVQAHGAETHVVELAPRLMPRQLDDVGSQLLLRAVESLGVQVHLGRQTRCIVGEPRVEGVVFDDGSRLEVDMVLISAGIRPRDELARDARLTVGERGGIVVDDELTTSDPNVFAIGECALHRGNIYGLVAPGYEMADVLARKLVGEAAAFGGADLSTQLKLLGVDVASFGDPLASGDDSRVVAYQDFVQGIYKKLVVSACGSRIIGGILVGDVKDYGTFVHYARSGAQLPDTPEALLLGARGGKAPAGTAGLPDEAVVCSCNAVSKGCITQAVRDGAHQLPVLKAQTCAGTGCGGCVPMVTDLLVSELAALGQSTKAVLCEHFDYTRQELFDIIRVKGIRTFEELIRDHGTGTGCELCKPTIASILASLHNEMILDRHATLQDTNDRFLANVQRSGLYSIVPRVPGGEITPEKLITLGEVAKKYGLYTKITGGQRVDLFGARVDQLPDIWEELIDAGFESGHAYGKALRTVKSCVGSSWCRYGVQDSVGLAIRVEERYRGLRSPHKLKSAVSGCVRECAEAQSKDFGIIATEKGWNLYVCGNGGSKPRHADLLVADVDEETLIRYVDRFLMYYIRTADKLTRTSVWLEKLEGGLDHVRDVVVRDTLGLADELEAQMQRLVDSYQCEWKAVVQNPELRARFKHFVNDPAGDDTVAWVEERGQRRPADRARTPAVPASDGSLSELTAEPVTNLAERAKRAKHLPIVATQWVMAGRVADFPRDGGISMKYGRAQLAVYRFESRGEWYATQNMCPHKQEMVLARGIIGDQAGEPKVACPLHKKTFSLQTGTCLSGEDYGIQTFPVKVEDDLVFVELPAQGVLDAALCPSRVECTADAAE